MNSKKIFIIEWELDEKEDYPTKDCLKTNIVDNNLVIGYDEERNRARVSFTVNLQNIQDQAIDLKKLNYGYRLDFKSLEPTQECILGDRIFEEKSISLRRNDIQPITFTIYLDDTDGMGKEAFIQDIKENVSLLTFTVSNSKGDELYTVTLVYNTG